MPINKPRKPISIPKKVSKELGLRFYISESQCSKCLSKPSLRYTVNSNCISCERKRYKKKGDQQ